jgi:nicotinamide phosphoribosyltransferase
MNTNPLFKSDSYKLSHWLQYPHNTSKYFGYGEARGGKYKQSLMFGMEILLQHNLSKPIKVEHIQEMEEFAALHGEPFNKTGWMHIVNKYGGYWPVTIMAAKEGEIIPERNVLYTVESEEDPLAFWAGSYIEAQVLRGIYYPTTVATKSHQCKETIYHFLKLTADDPANELLFKLHDFGARGVSSGESAEIGGCAHLVNFLGSDTMEGVWTANKFYKSAMAGFSIPAAEHSTITSWLRSGEKDAYINMIKQYGKQGAMFAVVSDSWSIKAACEMWAGELKELVVNSGATLVVRPDSGDPEAIIPMCLERLADGYGYTINSKGYKVLNNVRLIQGDRVSNSMIANILGKMMVLGWSASNIAFGMGGELLQIINRDDGGWAMKCSWLEVDGEGRDIYKDPDTEPYKKSKKGQMMLYKDCEDKYFSAEPGLDNASWMDKVVLPTAQLELRFKIGEIFNSPTLGEVRYPTWSKFGQ